jgi:NADH-quinone oxidoreductase subunit C
MGLPPKDVLDRIKAQFPGTEIVPGPGDPYGIVPREQVLDVARWLKATPELEFDFPTCVGGADDLKNLWSIWHLYSTKRHHRVTLKAKLDRESPSVASVCEVWPGANWHERESYDMYGIVYEGHPDLRRILLPEDWPGYPLRKDYDFPDHYQGIPLK